MMNNAALAATAHATLFARFAITQEIMLRPHFFAEPGRSRVPRREPIVAYFSSLASNMRFMPAWEYGRDLARQYETGRTVELTLSVCSQQSTRSEQDHDAHVYKNQGSRSPQGCAQVVGLSRLVGGEVRQPSHNVAIKQHSCDPQHGISKDE